MVKNVAAYDTGGGGWTRAILPSPAHCVKYWDLQSYTTFFEKGNVNYYKLRTKLRIQVYVIRKLIWYL